VTLKICAECKRTLELSAFHKNKRRADGHHEYCKNCRKAQYERRDKPSAVQRAALRYATKKQECLEGMRQRYLQQQQTKKAYGRKHYELNKSKYIHNANARKMHVRIATPRWFDADHGFVLQEAFELAKLREKTTGVPWDVDHIIPLQGKTVCGLHVKENIAVIPRALNNFKRAKNDGDRTLFYSRNKAR